MANTSSRTLQLLSLLQSHRFWPGTELADRLEISLRTLRRDVDRLRELGYPVQAQRGVDGGYQLAVGAALPPLVLDDEEAVAIAVGLMAAAQSPLDGAAESSVRALTKVVQVMPTRLRRQADALRAMTESAPSVWAAHTREATIDADALTVVAQACRDCERLRFGYSPATGAPGVRHVEPHRLVSLGRRWYLVAYDLDRHDWRSFRLDRSREIERAGSRFAPRRLPAPDAASFVRAGIAEAPATYEVEVVVFEEEDAVRSRLGTWATVEPGQPGTCVVRMKADSLDWPAMALGGLGAEFTVRKPADLTRYLAEWSGRFGRAVERRPAGMRGSTT